MSSDQTQLVERMMQIRAKYRVSNGKIKYRTELVAVHPTNRGGEPMAPTRIRELVGTITSDGYDGIDANTNGVLVQEKPVSGEENKSSRLDIEKKIAADRDVAEFGVKGMKAVLVVFLTAISIASSEIYRQSVRSCDCNYKTHGCGEERLFHMHL